MIKCTALEASKRLENIIIHYIIGAGESSKTTLTMLRSQNSNKMNNNDKAILFRFVELLSMAFGIPYEVESMLLIADNNALKNLNSEMHKSVNYLKNMEDTVLDCEESDNDFFLQYALFAMENQI